jgi:hypothetical protein
MRTKACSQKLPKPLISFVMSICPCHHNTDIYRTWHVSSAFGSPQTYTPHRSPLLHTTPWLCACECVSVCVCVDVSVSLSVLVSSLVRGSWPDVYSRLKCYSPVQMGRPLWREVGSVICQYVAASVRSCQYLYQSTIVRYVCVCLCQCAWQLARAGACVYVFVSPRENPAQAPASPAWLPRCHYMVPLYKTLPRLPAFNSVVTNRITRRHADRDM